MLAHKGFRNRNGTDQRRPTSHPPTTTGNFSMTTTSRRRILVLGATGFTGRQVVADLISHGHTPTLVGRSTTRLAAVVESLGTQLPLVQADVRDADAIAALIGSDDVVVSTVGPFQRWGKGVARAAARAGAVYLDSTGEPPFIRWAFDELGPLATTSGATLVPAFGYDFVPGNLAGALAVTRAAGRARHVQIGYFLLPGTHDFDRRATLRDTIDLTTGATRASLVGVIAEPAFAYRPNGSGSSLVTEMSGQRLHRFRFRDITRAGITIGGSEHFGLPELFPELESVEVCMGWFNGWSLPVQIVSTALSPVIDTALTRRLLDSIAAHLPGADRTPTRAGTSLVTAIARDNTGAIVSQVTLAGPDPYTMTGRLLGYGAAHAADHPLTPGVRGPVAAFGLDELHPAATDLGLVEVTDVVGGTTAAAPALTISGQPR